MTSRPVSEPAARDRVAATNPRLEALLRDPGPGIKVRPLGQSPAAAPPSNSPAAPDIPAPAP
ncbi:MAG: hypothetical protein ABL908_10680, partial [Hyphomicrobium sp.]